MTFVWPVSSSSVMNSTPFAVPGRWRTVTIPHARANCPLRSCTSSRAGSERRRGAPLRDGATRRRRHPAREAPWTRSASRVPIV